MDDSDIESRQIQDEQQLDESQLFLLRVWREEGGQDRAEYRGKLQHVLSPRAHLFRGRQALADLLMSLLPTSTPRAKQGAEPEPEKGNED